MAKTLNCQQTSLFVSYLRKSLWRGCANQQTSLRIPFSYLFFFHLFSASLQESKRLRKATAWLVASTLFLLAHNVTFPRKLFCATSGRAWVCILSRTNYNKHCQIVYIEKLERLKDTLKTGVERSPSVKKKKYIKASTFRTILQEW